MTDELHDYGAESLEAILSQAVTCEAAGAAEPWHEQDTTLSSAVLRCAASVEPKKVEWLWKPYIPLGKLTVVQGHPGVGKSFLALNLTAIVSSGFSFPDPETGIPNREVRQTPRSVLYASVEDAPEDIFDRIADARGR